MTLLARLHAAAYPGRPASLARGIEISLAEAREVVVAMREACGDCATCHECAAWWCESHGYGEPGCPHGEPLCLSCISRCSQCADDLRNDPDMAYDVRREEGR